MVPIHHTGRWQHMAPARHHSTKQVFLLPCEPVSGLQPEVHCTAMEVVWGTISCQPGDGQEWSSNSSYPPLAPLLTVINDRALCSAEPDGPRPPLAICSRPAPTSPPQPPTPAVSITKQACYGVRSDLFAFLLLFFHEKELWLYFYMETPNQNGMRCYKPYRELVSILFLH